MERDQPQACDRCGADFARTYSTMSYFNRDVICGPCKDDEALAPGYRRAVTVEAEHVRRGDFNYAGVGLSPEDAAFLAERRRQRGRA